jgi:hypothetical protein
MNNKLIQVVPIHTIVYIIVSSIVLGVFTTMLFISTWNLYYTICGIICCLCLLITSVISLSDWNKFINENIIKQIGE